MELPLQANNSGLRGSRGYYGEGMYLRPYASDFWLIRVEGRGGMDYTEDDWSSINS